MQYLKYIFLFVTFFAGFNTFSNERHYTLRIHKGEIKIGKETFSNKVLVNGSTPAPHLYFTEGETAVIKVINDTNKKTLIHWHGLLIKNDQDGVPYVNSLPIDPNSEKTYKFKLIQNGTYWYHSHVMYQEEDGLYGAFIIYPKDYEEKTPEETVVLSDISHEEGRTIQKNIKKQGEYYDVFKGTVQSWWEAFRSGHSLIKLRNSLQRMEGMDYADIAYDHFISNGKTKLRLFDEIDYEGKVKLRIINGSATSIYKITYGGNFITVIGADGLPIRPVNVLSLPISVAETYDILVDRKKAKTMQLKVTSIDHTGFSSILIGNGKSLQKAPNMYWEHPIGVTMGEMMGMKKMNFFSELTMNYRNEFEDISKDIQYDNVSEYSLPTMAELMPMMGDLPADKENEHSAISHSSNFRIMNRSPEVRESNIINKKKNVYKELNYGLMKATIPLDAKNKKLRIIKFTLNGNMGRYIWSINGTPMGPDTYIKIKKGERVRFVMKNTTMMNHPMHLHGHFFRVMTGQGKWSVLKHTVNVAPLDQVIIEFDADKEKDWFFHCHILYHMMGGMTRIVRYENNPGPQELEDARKNSYEFNLRDKFFLRSKNLFQSSYLRTESSYFNSFYAFDVDLISDYHENLEGEIHMAKILTRYLEPYIGVKTEANEGDYEVTPTLGFTWVLPLNIAVDVKYQPSMDDKFELELESEIQLTSKLQFNYEYSSIRNFYTELEYRQSKNLSFIVGYNKTFAKWGAGLGYTY